MRHFIYIISICFTVFLMSSCQKTELDDLKPMKVNAEERVDEANSIVSGGKGDNKDSNDDENGGGLPPTDQDDTITDDDDEDDDDEMEGGRVTENN